VFEPAALEPARRAVELDYLRDGYNGVRVTVATSVDESQGHVNLVLAVAEGRQQVLDGIDVKGAAITRRRVIDRALDVVPGQPANHAEFFRAETRLYDTGAFRTADITLVPLGSETVSPVERVRAEVRVQELPLYRFRYGFRVNDTVTPIEIDRALRPALVVDFLRRNLFGYGISAGAAGQLEADRRLLRGVVTLPRAFGLPVTTNLFATRSREDFTPEASTPFVDEQSGITAEQRFAPSPRMAVTYGYDYSLSRIFEPEPLPGIPALDLQAKIARLTSTYAWDRRNDPFSPQDGWFHSSGFELGAKALGSDLRFIRYLAQQYYYRTVRRIVLASALRLGLGRGFDQDLIPSERFYAGGGTTVRGFAEDGLGGVDFFGDPRGGNGMLVLNQEARIPLFGWVHGVAFVDAGNVFETASELSLSNLEAGAGGGLRINSPFALLRVDFGVPLTNRRSRSSGRWYFGIGHAF
jgi:outer membrane protein assembly factor BamA